MQRRYELKRKTPLRSSNYQGLKRSELAKVGKRGKQNASADAKDRKIAHERSGRLCEYCMENQASEVHHVRTKGAHGDLRHETDLQVDLCLSCHGKADSLIWNLTQFKRVRPEVYARFDLDAVLNLAKGRVEVRDAG